MGYSTLIGSPRHAATISGRSLLTENSIVAEFQFSLPSGLLESRGFDLSPALTINQGGLPLH